MLRIVLRMAGGLAALVFLIVAAGLGYRALRQHEIAKALAITTPDGVNEAMFVRIGGIDQWITIRGEHRSNPVLLSLHGGPGLAQDIRPRSWERDFTVVQWDQRGAGRTYLRNVKPARGLTIGRMAQDGIEVADFVRHRLHKQKIVLVGNSWGTILGLTMVKGRPDLFSAYVGAGNFVDQQRMDAAAYAALLKQARAKGDAKSLKALTAIGPPPWSAKPSDVERRILFAYDPTESATVMSLALAQLTAPGYSLGDVVRSSRAMPESIQKLAPQVATWKAERLGRDFKVAMVFFQGSEDLQTPTSVVEDYERWIAAPSKSLTLIPGDGHLALISHQDFVLKELVARVRPLAVVADAESASPAPRTPPAPRRAR